MKEILSIFEALKNGSGLAVFVCLPDLRKCVCGAGVVGGESREGMARCVEIGGCDDLSEMVALLRA